MRRKARVGMGRRRCIVWFDLGEVVGGGDLMGWENVKLGICERGERMNDSKEPRDHSVLCRQTLDPPQ